MNRCQACGGSGRTERDICRDCMGLGSLDAAEMLATLVAIRNADRMGAALGEPGFRLATPLRVRIAKVIATVANFEIERLAEIRAKEPLAEMLFHAANRSSKVAPEMIPCSICRGAHPRGVHPHAAE